MSRCSSVMAARGSLGSIVPRGNVRRCAEVEPSFAHEHADRGVQDRLRHRPRQQLRRGPDRLRGPIEVRDLTAVALDEQSSALDHQHGVRRAVPVGVGDQLVDEFVDARRRVADGPTVRVGRRPRHSLRLRGQRNERQRLMPVCLNSLRLGQPSSNSTTRSIERRDDSAGRCLRASGPSTARTRPHRRR